jgi:hypothetical protein
MGRRVQTLSILLLIACLESLVSPLLVHLLPLCKELLWILEFNWINCKRLIAIGLKCEAYIVSILYNSSSACFDPGLKSGDSSVYLHEMPGGQYTKYTYEINSLVFYSKVSPSA